MANALGYVFKWALPTAGVYALVAASMYDVKGGSRAVIFDRLSGVKEQVVNEGTHFLVPWLQKSIIYDVRTKPRNISTTTGSKDLQMVSLTLRVLHRPDVQKLPKIYQVSAPRYRSKPKQSIELLRYPRCPILGCIPDYLPSLLVWITTSVFFLLLGMKFSKP